MLDLQGGGGLQHEEEAKPSLTPTKRGSGNSFSLGKGGRLVLVLTYIVNVCY